MKKGAALSLVLCILFFAGCAAKGGHKPSPIDPKGVTSQKYADEFTQFSLGHLPYGWKKIWGYDGDLAYHNENLNATIMVNSTCNIRKQMPLVALRNHLLIDITERFVVEQGEVELDMRQALHTVVQGRLDGSLIKMEIYVVQIDTCVYDFAYIVGLEKYDKGKQAFRDFVQEFHAKRKG